MMDMETKEDGSILLEEKSLKMADVQPVKVTDDMINGIIKGQEYEMCKLSAFSNNSDEINVADGNETESDATTKFPHSIDVDFEPLQPVFVNPDEGTPAAEALAGTIFIALVIRVVAATFSLKFCSNFLFLLYYAQLMRH